MLKTDDQHHSNWIVWISLLIAYILYAFSTPKWMSFAWPDWVLVFVIYWIIYLPARFGLIFAFLAGFLLDSFFNNHFGINSTSFLITAFVCMTAHRRIKVHPLWQQSLYILLFTLLYKIINLWLGSIFYHNTPSMLILQSAITNAIIWPFIVKALTTIQKIFRVY